MAEIIKMRMDEYVGSRDHSKLYNRDNPDQHPITAITGLEDRLKQAEDSAAEAKGVSDRVEAVLADVEDRQAALDAATDTAVSNIGIVLQDAEKNLSKASTSAMSEIIGARNQAITIIDAKADDVSEVVSQVNTSVLEARQAADDAADARDRVYEYAGTVLEFDAKVSAGINSVESKKTEAVNAVSSKQAEAINAVDAQKTEGVNAVQSVIDTIPEDYTELIGEVSNVKKDLNDKVLLVDSEGYVCLGGLYE